MLCLYVLFISHWNWCLSWAFHFSKLLDKHKESDKMFVNTSPQSFSFGKQQARNLHDRATRLCVITIQTTALVSNKDFAQGKLTRRREQWTESSVAAFKIGPLSIFVKRYKQAYPFVLGLHMHWQLNRWSWGFTINIEASSDAKSELGG